MAEKLKPVVVVTGTSKGLGLQLAKMFVESGCFVFGCSRGDSSFESSFYRHSKVDIGEEGQVRTWIRGIKKEAGKIDILVCNAGVVESVLPLAATSVRVLDAYLKTNVVGTFLVCREVGKIMTVQRSGRIVAISTTMTRLHEPGTSAYSATKSAIEEIIRVLARELAGANITCNIVAPGLIPTDASESFGEDWNERMLDLQTIRKPITPSEIFHAISYFTSAAAASVTGQTLYMGLVD